MTASCDTPPTITTGVMSSIGNSSAVAEFDLSSFGSSTVTAVGFNYGLTDEYGLSTPIPDDPSYALGHFGEVIPDLRCDTTYHYQAFATSSAGTDDGDDAHFTTLACSHAANVTVPIIPPALTLSSPNGGQMLNAGLYTTITWSSAGAVGSLNLSYSTNHGSSWTSLATNVLASTGSYSWFVPATATTQGLVELQSSTGSLVAISAAPFTIIVPAAPAVEPTPVVPTPSPVPQASTPPTATTTLSSSSPGSTSGDLERGSASTVYWEAPDGFRHPFLDVQTYFTYLDTYNPIQQVPDTQLPLLPLGAPVTPNPGTVFVKVVSDPTVYVILPPGADGKPILRAIGSEAIATTLAGANWNAYVIDLPVTSFHLFDIGPVIQSAGDVVVNRALLKLRASLAPTNEQ